MNDSDFEPAMDSHLEMMFEDRISGTDDYWSIEVDPWEDDDYDDEDEE